MKLFLLLILCAGIIRAIIIPAKLDYAKMEEETIISGPHHPFMAVLNIIPVDSSPGEYSMLTQMHECLGI